MKIGYYAIFDYNEYDEKEEAYGISISFPDIPECISCARSEEEGLLMAQEALKLNTLTMQVYELPKMTPLKDINLKDNEKAFYISYNTEDIDLSEFTFYDDEGNVISLQRK
ncbi:type II toxin-antitoxin system HicB family antitoxin [Paramaledivibacter caminithermalis]|jgi:predicted RNase H-like HicB family nuclease|uniref:Uncharacterized protein n=1 Tax=Paramaledivibacter caminithermalis (strain DSM 15212 / CIP 107654 / DViRD3) TaxID=1121301 RepID=A0A1M6TBV7_PARC5|nr:type II toxin-antitoxin system HicB family antitoxin [Paramaledivibacter caminithermalis]SHK54354.1 hypothetical protein SAMN02745912_03630 [Paramaledivibacter caminithermalis DSM 15212]